MKWKISKTKFSEIDSIHFTRFFGLDFFKFSGLFFRIFLPDLSNLKRSFDLNEDIILNKGPDALPDERGQLNDIDFVVSVDVFLRAQSFTSLKEDLFQDINGVFAFIRCLNGTLTLRKCSVKALVS